MTAPNDLPRLTAGIVLAMADVLLQLAPPTFTDATFHDLRRLRALVNDEPTTTPTTENRTP